MLHIEKRFVKEMIDHARQDLPNECCGILAGQKGRVLQLYRMTNVEASPFRFSMDPKEIVRVDTEAGEKGWDLMAIYHSHVRSQAYPSDTDVRIASGTAALWPDVRYILVSLMDQANPEVRIFEIKDGAVSEEKLQIG